MTARAERVAANRTAVAARLGGGHFAVHGVRVPVERGPVTGPPVEYIEIGRCGKCRRAWRLNGAGGLMLHGPYVKRCAGSHELPDAREVVPKSLYLAGERWPKRKA